jgi:hypothetical protein
VGDNGKLAAMLRAGDAAVFPPASREVLAHVFFDRSVLVCGETKFTFPVPQSAYKPPSGETTIHLGDISNFLLVERKSRNRWMISTSMMTILLGMPTGHATVWPCTNKTEPLPLRFSRTRGAVTVTESLATTHQRLVVVIVNSLVGNHQMELAQAMPSRNYLPVVPWPQDMHLFSVARKGCFRIVSSNSVPVWK